MLRLSMTVSYELILSVIIQLVSVGIFIGMFRTSLNFMQEQIKELKEDMKRYNNILQRMIVAEQNIKAIWHNIDDKEK